jgi:hypothetical protein
MISHLLTRVDLAGGTVDIPLFLFLRPRPLLCNSLMARCRIETRDDDG